MADTVGGMDVVEVSEIHRQWRESHASTAEIGFRAISPGFIKRNPNLANLYLQISRTNPPRPEPGPGQSAGPGPTDLARMKVPTLFIVGEEDELMFVKLRYKTPDGERSQLLELPVPDRVESASTDLRFAASVAAFGMLLRDSEQCGDFTLAEVSRLARGSLGEDRHGYRAEFVRLVEATRELSLLES